MISSASFIVFHLEKHLKLLMEEILFSYSVIVHSFQSYGKFDLKTYCLVLSTSKSSWNPGCGLKE